MSAAEITSRLHSLLEKRFSPETARAIAKGIDYGLESLPAKDRKTA